MSQIRLIMDFSTISIEKDVAETMNYDNFIHDFASKKARKKSF